jgi:hypothetical protein
MHTTTPTRALVVATLCAAAGLAATPGANASPKLQVGLVDSTETLNGNPGRVFPILKQLGVQVLRVNLSWGGRVGVASRRPADATNPGDPAYDWSVYDRAVNYAAQYGIKILFTIDFTPAWANGGARENRAPLDANDLRDFAHAAAIRYSGSYPGADGRALPPVRMWTAWNEPNNPVFLSPQFTRVGKRWVIQSARDYARICKAVYDGVHSTELRGEHVACGATAPRGNNSPRSARPSVSPIAFVRALKAAGLEQFDAYDHHPYGRGEAPDAPPTGRSQITLANIDDLTDEVARLWGPKRLWIGEYGYETNPPDHSFGVSPKLQAEYVTRAFGLARANPSVDLMIWFLLRDETRAAGWQSGFLTAAGRPKPAFAAFQRLRR